MTNLDNRLTKQQRRAATISALWLIGIGLGLIGAALHGMGKL